MRQAMSQAQISILFSEAHDERLKVDQSEDGLTCTHWIDALKEHGFRVDHNRAVLTELELEQYVILVLGSPQKQLSQSEIDAITSYVDHGGGLLLINDAQAVRSPKQNLNELAKGMLCQFREYLNAFPTSVELFLPHYVTAGLVSLTTDGNCRLASLAEKARRLAIIPETDENLAVCGEIGGGRVIAVADSAPFINEHWEAGSNHVFAVQCCLWLARRNFIDLHDATIDSPIQLGRTGTMVLTLVNPLSTQLRRVNCILEANTDVTITEGVRGIRIVPPGEQAHMRWRLQPETIGLHQLRLIVEASSDTSGQAEILFNRVAQFMCTAPVSLDLEVMESQGKQRTEFATGERFRVEGTVKSLSSDVRSESMIDLVVPDTMEVLQKEVFGDTTRWYIKASTPGHYDVAVIIPRTGQRRTTSLSIRPSLDYRRERIEADYVEPLDAEIVRRLVRVHPLFGDESVSDIPFRILSPEDYIKDVYPSKTIGEHFRDVLASARRETQYNLRLLNEILLNIAPIYSVRYGACAPFDPGLASRWAQLHPTERESLLYNFLQLEDSRPTTIQQNVAAYLLHEKYGHGFFFAHTSLGQQLAILDRHYFLREVDEEWLPNPYPRRIRQQYAEAIEALDHSSIIVNEGFAAWVELNFLAQMESEIAAAAHPRKVFLIWKARRQYDLIEESRYYQNFRPLFDSPYQEGYEKLAAIQRIFGNYCGEKCAVQFFLKATDIFLGIKQGAHGPEFGLSAEDMLDVLTNPEQPDDTRSDQRMRRIFNVLVENQDQLRSKQRRLQCHRSCPHPDCAVRDLIAAELGW
jgi:hypothetical protein